MTPDSVAGAAPMLRASPWTVREWILWSALAIALSASWSDLASHWLAEPWARPAALFLPLFLLAGARDRHRPAAPRSGALLVAAGLLLSLLAFGGGVARLGRIGVPIALIGMARALGRPAPTTALLALWVIPPPSFLLERLSPGLEHALAWLAAEAFHAQGLPAALGPRALQLSGATLELRPPDGGIPLAVQLAGIGWWLAAWHRGGLRTAAGAALRLAPLGFVAQAIGLCLAFALLAGGAATAARTLLDWWAWPVLALALALPLRAGWPAPVPR